MICNKNILEEYISIYLRYSEKELSSTCRKYCEYQGISFSREKENLCANVVHEKGKCICRKACMCHLLVVKKTQSSIRSDKWHR